MNVVFRCNATTRTGLGHVSRCLALAEACSELGAKVSFAGVFEPIADRLLEGYAVERLEDVRAPTRGELVVVDSYDFDASDVSRIETSSLVLVDDFAVLGSYADSWTILNFTVAAETLAYPAGARRFLGPRYFLARRPLRALGARPLQPAKHVLVSMGGVDRFGYSKAVAETLRQLNSSLEITVVSGMPIEGLDVKVGLPSLAPIFAAVDTVVSGGGLTKYEAASLGLPTAVLSQTDDQARETTAFEAKGLAIALDREALESDLRRLLSDDDLRARLSTRCAEVFQGDTTLRAARAILEQT